MQRIVSPANQPGWEERGVWREKLERDREWKARGWVRCEDPACDRPLPLFASPRGAILNTRHAGCRAQCGHGACDELFVPGGDRSRYCSEACRYQAMLSRKRRRAACTRHGDLT